MSTLYHAAGPHYLPGDPLLSLVAQVEEGMVTAEDALQWLARWEADARYLLADGALVSLTPDLNEARRIRAEYNGGAGVILALDGEALREDGLLKKNAEGYPAVLRRIGPEYILGAVE